MRGSRGFARLNPALYHLSTRAQIAQHAEVVANPESVHQPDTSALPAAELSVSPESGRRHSWRGIFNSVRASQILVSKIPQKKSTIKYMVFSYHGYSSLRMFEARPRACMNKVSGRRGSGHTICSGHPRRGNPSNLYHLHIDCVHDLDCSFPRNYNIIAAAILLHDQ